MKKEQRDLGEYRKKRNFQKTSEPEGKGLDKSTANKQTARKDGKEKSESPDLETGVNAEDLPNKGKDGKKGARKKFAVQYHLARREHYDFRLEWRGVLLSWAIPKGPSYNPRDKRLAVMVEDHPLEYAEFEGTIPKGEYGGGTVMLWDEGEWEPYNDIDEGLKQGSLKFTLYGNRLKGRWTLVRFGGEESEERNWLLIKEKDGLEKRTSGIERFSTGIRSGRTAKEIGREEDKTKKTNPMTEINVQLAKLTDKVPKDGKWLYEVKYDGYRVIAFIEGGKTLLLSRNGKDFKERFYTIREALTNFSAGRAAVLDGEAVIADENGKTDFQALQSYLRKPDGRQPVYMVFDILALDGEDMRDLPLIERKEKLKEFLKHAPANIVYVNHVSGNGERCFKAAAEADLEGIVGKRADSVYSGTRNGDWIKLKCYNSQEFVIGGYTLSDKKSEGISALLLGEYFNGDFVYAGRAGTGFGEKEEKELLKDFKNLRSKNAYFRKPPEKKAGETIFWLKPELVAQIQFAERTDAGFLRQASFKGLREDKDAKDVVREDYKGAEEVADTGNERKNSKTANAFLNADAGGSGAKLKAVKDTVLKDGADSKKSNGRSEKRNNKPESASEKKVYASNADSDEIKVCGVKISNPAKIVYKQPEITKLQVVQYYEKVSRRMLKYAGGRVMSVVRCHKGVSGECFFKKHPISESEGMEIIPVINKEGEKSDYFYIENPTGLIGEAQLGSIEYHIWGSRAATLDKPDMMVFDLDPDEGMDISQVRRGVRDLKKVLDELSLRSFLKTSGGKGYHIVVPFEPTVNWEEFHDFARHIAELMEARWPNRYTSNVRKNKRKGKIFIDWARNGRGSTSVAPYSLRARAGAKVSMPIAWSELDKVTPDGVDMFDALKRLKKPDPWKNYASVKQKLKFDE